MNATTREARLAASFVTLADTLVADFDLVELLQHLVDTCADLLDATSVGLLLKNPAGGLDVIASTTEDAKFIEIVQLGASAGPCWECAATGKPVTVPDIAAIGARWPAFRDAAIRRGIRSVHATPMRLRDQVIGTMNLFKSDPVALNDQDTAVAQALTDVATIGILSERAARESRLVTQQLQYALENRIVIEQAKGVLAQSLALDMEDAFRVLRSYARSHNLGISSVATALTSRQLLPADLADGTRGTRPRPASD